MTPAMRILLMGRAFSPSVLFRAGEAGIWLDQGDSATGYQDSAATTANVLDSPIGKRLDKSGRGNHVLQATAGARPTWKLDGAIYSDLFDGTDDGYATAAFSAGTLTSNMDCFIAVKRNSAARFVTLSDTPTGDFRGVADSAGGASLASVGSGAYINGTAVPGGAAATRVQLDTAMPVGSWLVFEMRNLDLSLWPALVMGYSAFRLNGNIAGVVLCTAQSDARRAQIRRALGRKVGLSL